MKSLHLNVPVAAATSEGLHPRESVQLLHEGNHPLIDFSVRVHSSSSLTMEALTGRTIGLICTLSRHMLVSAAWKILALGGLIIPRISGWVATRSRPNAPTVTSVGFSAVKGDSPGDTFTEVQLGETHANGNYKPQLTGRAYGCSLTPCRIFFMLVPISGGPLHGILFAILPTLCT